MLILRWGWYSICFCSLAALDRRLATLIKNLCRLRCRGLVAEREGFEPPVPCGTLDFESSTFDHSDTSPRAGCKYIKEDWNSINDV